MKRTEPLLILCKRVACDGPGWRRVRRPWEQRAGGYCTRRCAALDTVARRRAALIRSGRRLGRARASQLRARLLNRLHGLTPLQAFRVGYTTGLESKLRQIRKRYTLVRKAGA